MTAFDGDRIRDAIRAAEEGTSGRIAVRVVHTQVENAFERARDDFHNARLHEHPDSNAVLFLVAPKSRRFAVYGGDAIHARLGDAFWQRLIAEMTPHFAQGHPTEALAVGISRVGESLREQFPSAVSA